MSNMLFKIVPQEYFTSVFVKVEKTSVVCIKPFNIFREIEKDLKHIIENRDGNKLDCHYNLRQIW